MSVHSAGGGGSLHKDKHHDDAYPHEATQSSVGNILQDVFYRHLTVGLLPRKFGFPSIFSVKHKMIRLSV